VPGYGAGVVEPTGNLAWFIDSNLLAGHTWRGAPVPGFDPEGIFSTIPAIGTALMGVLTGHLLRSRLTGEEKTAWMFVAGNFLLLAGAILDMWFPINKALWTSSYVIFMAGWANVCLAMFYWLIDVKGYRTWATPFVIYGMNAITVFVLSGLVAKTMGLIRWTAGDGQKYSVWSYIYQTVYVPLGSPMNTSLLFAISFISMMFLVVWFMWKKRWFLKV
jgi:predicted acyltransferase